VCRHYSLLVPSSVTANQACWLISNSSDLLVWQPLFGMAWWSRPFPLPSQSLQIRCIVSCHSLINKLCRSCSIINICCLSSVTPGMCKRWHLERFMPPYYSCDFISSSSHKEDISSANTALIPTVFCGYASSSHTFYKNFFDRNVLVSAKLKVHFFLGLTRLKN
jgi:hypothetical protein